jgi:hypothetical protein
LYGVGLNVTIKSLKDLDTSAVVDKSVVITFVKLRASVASYLDRRIFGWSPSLARFPVTEIDVQRAKAGAAYRNGGDGSREASIDQSPETPTVVAARRASFRVVNRIA